jgi:hypothetical protein
VNSRHWIAKGFSSQKNDLGHSASESQVPDDEKKHLKERTRNSPKTYPFQNRIQVSNRGGSIFLYVTRTIWELGSFWNGYIWG